MFACLHLPELPIEAALLRQPDLLRVPAAVVAIENLPNPSKAPLLSVNSAAAARGLRPGESSVRALALCPELRLLPRDPQAEQELHETLLVIAESLGPDFECPHPGTIIIDLAGCRPPQQWDPPLSRLRLVLAETPDLAHLAAMADMPFSNRPLAADDLDSLPLEILASAGVSDHESLLPVLRLWGLRSLGEFRRLPRQEIADRLGPDAMRLHDVLHGKLKRLLKLHRPVQTFAQTLHFEYPIESLEALLFEANRAFQTLCARLESHHRAAGKIRFAIEVESSERLERTIMLPEPLASPAALVSPLHTALETLHLPSGIVSLELELEPALPLSAQREWLGRQLRQPSRWPDTLARLEALLGPGRVGIPERDDSHRPDAFHLRPASGDAPVGDAGNQLADVPPLPLRRFRPPLKVAVASSGPPSRPQPLAILTGPHAGPISRVRGPFPLSGNWWEPGGAWQRLEWDIELDNRHLLRLVLIPPDEWQLDGIYC